MVSLTRLSILVADSDEARSRETAELLRGLGIQHVAEASGPMQLGAALRQRAFDILICAERPGEDGVAVLRAARRSAPATRAVLARAPGGGQAPAPSDVEVIELPLSRAALQELLQQTASPHGGLWCEVPALSLSDILQMYHQARRSVTVLLSGPVAGRVRLDAGEIVDAEMGDERGMAALSRLLEAETGLIRTAPPPPDAERTIDAPFQSVLLEAAQKLDERRRDDRLASEMTSVSADVLRPSVLPTLQAQPDPASFLAPPSSAQPRRRWGVALVGVMLGAALALGTALYLDRERARARHEPAAAAPEAPRDVQETALALTPARPAPGEPARAPADAPATAEAAPTSFTLRITSKPSRATVLEAGKALGKTPLELTIEASSVADAPRRFVLRHAGYLPSRLYQASSTSDVNAMVVLTPRSAPGADKPDAGRPDPEGASGSNRDTGYRGRKKELNARPRR